MRQLISSLWNTCKLVRAVPAMSLFSRCPWAWDSLKTRDPLFPGATWNSPVFGNSTHWLTRLCHVVEQHALSSSHDLHPLTKSHWTALASIACMSYPPERNINGINGKCIMDHLQGTAGFPCPKREGAGAWSRYPPDWPPSRRIANPTAANRFGGASNPSNPTVQHVYPLVNIQKTMENHHGK